MANALLSGLAGGARGLSEGLGMKLQIALQEREREQTKDNQMELMLARIKAEGAERERIASVNRLQGLEDADESRRKAKFEAYLELKKKLPRLSFPGISKDSPEGVLNKHIEAMGEIISLREKDLADEKRDLDVRAKESSISANEALARDRNRERPHNIPAGNTAIDPITGKPIFTSPSKQTPIVNKKTGETYVPVFGPDGEASLQRIGSVGPGDSGNPVATGFSGFQSRVDAEQNPRTGTEDDSPEGRRRAIVKVAREEYGAALDPDRIKGLSELEVWELITADLVAQGR